VVKRKKYIGAPKDSGDDDGSPGYRPERFKQEVKQK